MLITKPGGRREKVGLIGKDEGKGWPCMYTVRGESVHTLAVHWQHVLDNVHEAQKEDMSPAGT